MSLSNKKEPILLLLGDLFFFLLALWGALLVRHLEAPTRELFLEHLAPFSFLFVLWVIVFYIAGLYEKHTTILKSKLPSVIFNTQLANSGLAIAFFYLVPFLTITPKTLLFIYLVISFGVILLWRRHGYFFIASKQKLNAVLIGSGEEMRELMEEVNQNPVYNLRFVSSVDLSRADGDLVWKEIVSRVYAEEVSVIAIDLSNDKVEPVLPHLYNLIFSNIDFIDMHKIYEDRFDRVPLSLLKYNWFLENISTTPRGVYGALKRIMDIVISAVLLVPSFILFPFIILAIKLDSPGPAFITQERFGKNKKMIKVLKFRSMKDSDGGIWPVESDSRITKVGAYLRRMRLDELPQLLNVLKGDLSLIGPRPDIIDLGVKLAEEIPYYNVRNIIKPGLSGWAQIKQDTVPHSLEETRKRLAYDLYYVKNRSFLLDVKIAIRTIKTLLSRAGR